MARRRSPLRALSSAVVGFLVAGCLTAGVVTIVSDGRDSRFNPWVVGFGGTLVFVICAGQTALAGREIWRSWQLRLFGEETWAILIDKEYRLDSDLTAFWKAHVTVADFRHTIDTGTQDPGPVGEPLRVRRHAASGQVELVRAYGVFATVMREVGLPFGLLVLAAFTAGIGYLLVRGALGLLR